MRFYKATISVILVSLACQACTTSGGTGYRTTATTAGSVGMNRSAEAAETAGAEIPASGSPEAITPEKSSVFRGQSSGDNAPVKPASTAVVALLDKAGQAQKHGDLGTAAATLERGLRIAPHDARLWNRLAQVRVEQERYHQAESMAKKSNSLARGNRRLLYANWMTIATAREQRKDLPGKAAAIKEALKYQ